MPGSIFPAKCWKILVVVPEAGGNNDLRKIDRNTRVIAVIMPNDDTQVRDEWEKYRVSVTAIEKETGYKFFTAIPGPIAAIRSPRVSTMTPVRRPPVATSITVASVIATDPLERSGAAGLAWGHGAATRAAAAVHVTNHSTEKPRMTRH